MPRPPLARERVLDAYEAILIDEGERAATVEAVARAAGVSKGGLLYHFASKEELSEGLMARLDALVTEDVARMTAAPEGTVEYYIRTSVMDDDPIDRALVATSRLAQTGHPAAVAALRRARQRWADTLRPDVRDETSLHLVMLLSDGLYFNNALTASDQTPGLDGAPPTGAALDALIALVRRVTT